MSVATLPERPKSITQAPFVPPTPPAAVVAETPTQKPAASPISWSGDRVAVVVWLGGAAIIGFQLFKDMFCALLFGW